MHFCYLAYFGCPGKVQNGWEEGERERQSIVKFSCTSSTGRNGSVLSIISVTLVQECFLVGGAAEVMEKMLFGLSTSGNK